MFKLILVLCVAATALADRYHPHEYQGKIIGGTETTIEKFPYQVSLRYISTHMCGGSIIDESTVITAAHCVYGKNPTSFTLLTGTKSINDNKDPGKVAFVSKVIIHENYNTTSQHNDIAILKLFMPLTFTNKIQPIALQEQGDTVLPFTTGVITGWGRTQEGKPNPPGPVVLREATVAVLDRDTCIARYGDKITGSMMCAQTAGKDSCQGDSGGPLAANDKLIGVVSWGIGCGRPAYPGVYTQISELRSWIDANRGKHA